MKFAVVVFPGSNCDHDAYHAVKHALNQDAIFLWHKDTNIPQDIDCIILPGGFSYGDYLRSGAIARFSPIMNEIIKFSNNGGYVMGICNGFQILTEAGLLPGTLLRNSNLSFLGKDIYMRTEHNNSDYTNLIPTGKVLKVPIAHNEGNYFADNSIIDELENNNRVLFRYSDKDGNLTENPNGSINNIAGILNSNGNVMGLMPHPERCCDDKLGRTDGAIIFQSLINKFK